MSVEMPGTFEMTGLWICARLCRRFPLDQILSVHMLQVLMPNPSLNRTARRRRLRAVRSAPVSLVRQASPMKAIRTWGLRIIAALMAVVAVRAVIAVAETGREHLRVTLSPAQYSWLGTVVVAVVLLGYSFVFAIASSPRFSSSAQLWLVVSALLLGGVGLFAVYALGAA